MIGDPHLLRWADSTAPIASHERVESRLVRDPVQVPVGDAIAHERLVVLTQADDVEVGVEMGRVETWRVWEVLVEQNPHLGGPPVPRPL